MEQIFEKINELFDEYLKTLNLANTETAKLAIEEKIILTVWKANKNYREYSVEVIEKVKESLKYFPDSKARKNGGEFSKYLFNSLQNSIGSTKGEESLEQKTGLSISDEDQKLIRKINKCIKRLLKMDPLLDNDAIIGKVAAILKKDESEITDLLNLAKTTALGLEMQNHEDNESVMIEEVFDIVGKNPIEDWFASLEAREKALFLIDSEWNKKPDQMLSELLTIKVLDANLNVENMENYTFLNKEIYDNFRKDPERKLPEESEIAEKYGLTKSAASKKISRFLNLLKNF